MLQKKAQILWCGYTQYLDLERIMHSVVNTKKEEKKKRLEKRQGSSFQIEEHTNLLLSTLLIVSIHPKGRLYQTGASKLK